MAHSLPKSSLLYVLEALVPYTEANTKLAFKPNLFFRDLEKISQRKKRTLQNAYYKAHKAGYIGHKDDQPVFFTPLGQRFLSKTAPPPLDDGTEIIVIFDIPEKISRARRRFRSELRQLSFKQVQKSVWSSGYNQAVGLKTAIEELDIGQHVQVYKATRL